MAVKKVLLGAAMLLGLAAGSADAVTVSTGDTVRIDYPAPAYDPFAIADFYVFFSGFDAGESLTAKFFTSTGLLAAGNITGPGGGFFVSVSGGTPDFYYLLTNVIGAFDIDGASVFKDGIRGEGVVTVNAVPIPAALPLLAAGLSAMGFMSWRSKRKSSAA